MGWWYAPDNPKIITGDVVLDTIRRFLRELSHVFQEDLGRKPTVAELEYALNLALKANLD